MSGSDYVKLMAKTYSEEALLVEVLGMCVERKLAHVHFDTAVMKSGGWGTAQRGTGGFPDLVAVGSIGVLFAELKTESGSTSPTQKVWAAALGALESFSGGYVRYRLWKPRDLLDGTIVRELDGLE